MLPVRRIATQVLCGLTILLTSGWGVGGPWLHWCSHQQEAPRGPAKATGGSHHAGHETGSEEGNTGTPCSDCRAHCSATPGPALTTAVRPLRTEVFERAVPPRGRASAPAPLSQLDLPFATAPPIA